ncbi:Uncharacterised protein [Mycobacteroides abscessus subsp. abscessus]|nr:Uncharacterised protein [Mycobacteroides abscessus subsp. abscessus]
MSTCMPSSSTGTSRSCAPYDSAVALPLVYVGDSTTTRSPGSTNSLDARSRPCMPPVVMTRRSRLDGSGVVAR